SLPAAHRGRRPARERRGSVEPRRRQHLAGVEAQVLSDHVQREEREREPAHLNVVDPLRPVPEVRPAHPHLVGHPDVGSVLEIADAQRERPLQRVRLFPESGHPMRLLGRTCYSALPLRPSESRYASISSSAPAWSSRTQSSPHNLRAGFTWRGSTTISNRNTPVPLRCGGTNDRRGCHAPNSQRSTTNPSKPPLTS